MKTKGKDAQLVRDLLSMANGILLAELERRIRAVLNGKNPAWSAVMAMGGIAFYDRSGQYVEDSAACLRPVFDLLYEFNSVFHITGNPMRFDGPDSPKVTDW